MITKKEEILVEPKKETQKTIIEIKPNIEATKEEFLSILRLVSPGTHLRHGLNGVVDAKKGALVVVENEKLTNILDGGFKVNCRFTPQRLIELAKMDGAIILSKDMKRILYANVMLAPDIKITTKETGTRHKAAERTAKMLGTLTIAVSERKNQISMYYKNVKYHLRATEEILRSATETLHILEKQRELFDKNIEKLNSMESQNDLNLLVAFKAIQKGKMMEKIIESQEKTLIELGHEGTAIKHRIKELIKDIEKETDLIIKDYTKLNLKKSKNILSNLSYEELTDIDNIAISLAQKESNSIDNIKGWRILSRSNLAEKDIANLIAEFKNLDSIINSKTDKFSKVVGDDKAWILAKELAKIKTL
ncbi:MAG TPA: DNA integrity scanning diadenylate cyclase DisA [Candidatus Nanoarchaeia archaeon]|nr:DNA integrity scanning diadenylate cyclase DisA [Candidatus Nanoarchaeia archaeon]